MKPLRLAGWLWAAPAALLVLGLVGWPMLYLVRLSLCEGGGQSGFGLGGSFYTPGTWTLHGYQVLIGDRYFWEIWGFTLWLGFVVTGLCILLGYPTAHMLWQLPRRWKGLALACVIIPKVSNLLVTAYGLKLILEDHGPVDEAFVALHLVREPLPLQHSATGVVIGETLLVLPYTILMIWAGLERLDRQLLAAARGLGASAWQTFVRITWPLSLPAVGAAVMVSLIWALGAFVSPYLLGSPEQMTLAMDVQRQMFENLNWPRGAGEGVAMLATLVIIAGGLTFLRSRLQPSIR